MKRLPGGDVVHELLTNEKMTLQAIGDKYGVKRQAVHKLHKKWAIQNNVEWRLRPNRIATEEN